MRIAVILESALWPGVMILQVVGFLMNRLMYSCQSLITFNNMYPFNLIIIYSLRHMEEMSK